MKYNGLTELIAQDSQAKDYYEALPQYVKDQMSQRDQNVNSFKSLRDYAENLLRGDG